jgi:hypothetical protein
VWKESTTASTTAIAIFRRTRTADLAMPTLTAGRGKFNEEEKIHLKDFTLP